MIAEDNEYSNQDTHTQSQVSPQSPQYDRVTQEERVSNFISQTSPSKSLTKIDFILKGYMYDESQGGWVRVTSGIPDDIRMDVLQVLTPNLSEDVRMTRLDPIQINGIMTFLIEWSVDYFDIIADDKGLTEEQMTKLCNIIWSAVFYTLSRAVNGRESDKVYGSLKLGDDFGAYAKAEQSKSILSSFLPWK